MAPTTTITTKARPKRTPQSIVWGVEARYLTSSRVFRWNSGQTEIFRNFVFQHHPNHKSCDPTALYEALNLHGYEDVETEDGDNVLDIIRVKVNRKIDNVAKDMSEELEIRAKKRVAQTQARPAVDNLRNGVDPLTMDPLLQPKTEVPTAHLWDQPAPASAPMARAGVPQGISLPLRPYAPNAQARSQIPSPPVSPASTCSSHSMKAETPRSSSPVRPQARHAAQPPPAVVVPPAMRMPHGVPVRRHATTPANQIPLQQGDRCNTARRIAPTLAQIAQLHEQLHELTLSIENDCASQREWLLEWTHVREQSGIRRARV